MSTWLLLTSALADTCGTYASPETIQVGGVPEASGLAVSRTRAGVLFTHEDKGSDPVIVAVDASGVVLGEHFVTNAENEDWEDLAAAPCPDEGDCLYIGDIGDNDRDRPSITVYVVREPDEGDDRVKAIERWTAVYPDGPHDAEALLMMPCSGRLHVVTKDADGRSIVFRFPAAPDDVVTLEEVGRLEIGGAVAEAREITGGDWDLDGDRLALRTSSAILEWDVDPERPNAHWLDAPHVIEGANELQGEAVAYDLDGGLWTATEGGLQLGRFECEGYTPSDHECVFPQTGRSGCGCGSGAPAGGAWLGLALLLGRVRAGR